MKKTGDKDQRKNILDRAEELFMNKGYDSVTLRDIANEVGIRHASLYYYVPGGKQQLYIEVMERSFQRHNQGLSQFIQEAGEDFRQQVHAVVKWFMSQPPMDFLRMTQSDLPALEQKESDRLVTLAYDSLRTPIVEMLTKARQQRIIRAHEPNLVAMTLISLIQSVHNIPMAYRFVPIEVTALQVVDMMLDGLLEK